MEINIEIGTSLKAIRRQNKMTQKEVANFLSISTMSYSRYEQNLRQPDFETLAKLAVLFGVGIEFFFDNIHNIKELEIKYESILNEDNIDDFEELKHLESLLSQRYRVERRATKYIFRVRTILNGSKPLEGELAYLKKQLKALLKEIQFLEDLKPDFGEYKEIDDEIISILSKL
jgi:transcriptional regulator with XRE-family HTH domain